MRLLACCPRACRFQEATREKYGKEAIKRQCTNQAYQIKSLRPARADDSSATSVVVAFNCVDAAVVSFIFSLDDDAMSELLLLRLLLALRCNFFIVFLYFLVPSNFSKSIPSKLASRDASIRVVVVVAVIPNRGVTG